MKVLIVFYSMTGNVLKMARAVAEGVKEGGAEPQLRKAIELMSEEQLQGVAQRFPAAKQCQEELATIPTVEVNELAEADGIIFGSPTRYGNMAAQLKEVVDMTGPLWMKGALAGKPAAVFTSTSTAHGGNETTLISMLIPLLHHGMVLVGLPPTHPELAKNGSYYGATSVGVPTEEDLKLCRELGKRVAEITVKLSS